MSKAKKSLAFASYEDIFMVEELVATTEQVLELQLYDLHLPENFPFKLREDAALLENVESIKEGNAIVPCVVRPREMGGYEVIAGQRTMRACELAERATVPVIATNMDDDAATILMVNSNLPQDKVLPSEMAWALRMKLEALCHRGRKMEDIDPGTLSVEILMEQTGKSKNQIYRFVHFTELVPALLDMVDAGRIAFSVAADYLYKLTRKEQAWLLDSIEKYGATPSTSQALRLRQLAGHLTQEQVDGIMSEQKKESIKVTLGGGKLRQYFPEDYTPKQMEDVILQLLDHWLRVQRKSA